MFQVNKIVRHFFFALRFVILYFYLRVDDSDTDMYFITQRRQYSIHTVP